MSLPTPRGDDESQRAVAALRRQIACSPLSQRKIEERAGFARGYLSQVLAGRLDLKVSHLLTVLDTLSLSPGRFFAQLHPRPEPRALEALRRRAQRPEIAPQVGLDRLEGPSLSELGLESVTHLRRRLERCEQALGQLEGLGIVSMSPLSRRSEGRPETSDE